MELIEKQNQTENIKVKVNAKEKTKVESKCKNKNKVVPPLVHNQCELGSHRGHGSTMLALDS